MNGSIRDDDRAFLFGDGLFETVRVWPDGSVRWLGRHVERLVQSGDALGFCPRQIKRARGQLEAVGDRRPGIWRMTVSRDQAGAPFGGSGVIRWRYRPYQPRERPHLGVVRGGYVPADHLAEHKTCNYLRSVELLRRARLDGFEDAIGLSSEGLIGECAWANVVLVVDGRAHTPEARGLLPGVTRSGILAHYDESIEVAPLRAELLEEAQEVVLLSAGVGALAAKSLLGRPLEAAWARGLDAWLREVR